VRELVEIYQLMSEPEPDKKTIHQQKPDIFDMLPAEMMV
jgi:hypothetical protein